MTYRAPLDDIRLALATAGGLDDLIERGLAPGLDGDLVEQVLGEAAKFAEQQLAPLSRGRRPAWLETGRRQGRHAARLAGGL